MVASGPELLPRAMFGSVVLLQLGSVVIPIAHVSKEVIGTKLC